MPRPKRRMTPADFDAVRALLKQVSDDRAAVARAALVDGETLAVIAERHQCTRQAVNGAVDTFWSKLAEYHEAEKAKAHAGVLVPPGWEVVTIVAPTEMIEKFRADLAALPSSAGAKKTTSA